MTNTTHQSPPRRPAVHRLRARVRRPGRGRLPGPRRARAGQAVDRTARLRDGHRALRLPHRGGYRFVHAKPEGEEFAFNGVFHIVRENEFAIQTFEFEGFPEA